MGIGKRRKDDLLGDMEGCFRIYFFCLTTGRADTLMMRPQQAEDLNMPVRHDVATAIDLH